ncbi:hypothetical protein PVAND_007527 [Polypedilum vanderplanki]|uniref:SOCS box domain-containing protein n=1 Tax=Polypedilum vanderplanki TaxID=319348 RepID=A0A9J6C825_POLVA|nr:hypothetical protein PVAND_007527 [Polypedilum vanderplanki]
MGNSVFRSGGLLLSVNRDNAKLSESTASKIETIFDVLRANPKISIQRLEALLLQIPKHENILNAHDNLGYYNLLQKSVELNHIDLVKWILTTRPHIDLNRYSCSLPLHIACLKGHEELVELLIKYGARLDTEARMCFPGPHQDNCEEKCKYKNDPDNVVCERSNTKLQNCISYAIDGDQVNVLNILSQKMEEPWALFRGRKPLLLLHLACEKGAWRCVQHLVTTRSDEINLLKDEFYPIHYAVLHDSKFLELLIANGAYLNVRTSTQQMTLLHVVILTARKNADDTLNTLKILLEHGCKELINAPDYLGTTPLNAIIIRYALEEARYGYDKWSKYEVLNLVRFLLQNGARISINQPGNSALACVFRHIRDWEVCYELVNMMFKEETYADPNLVGRDGSSPLMVCLVPLINKDPLHSFTHSMKVFYLNCIRLLLQHGANPNCSYRSNLTPLHILIFTVSENFTVSVNCDIQKRANFDFIKNILILLLQHGLDCKRAVHPHQSIVEMVQNVRRCTDVLCIYELLLLILQYGGDANIALHNSKTPGSIINEALSFESGSGSGSNSNNAGSSSQIRHLQVSNNILFYFIMLIMRKEFILTDPDKNYLKIINLFYATMRHDVLYSCLKSLHNLFIVQVPTKSTEYLINYIESLYRKPRSLKELCRVTIYESLSYKLAQNINRLNMPGPIKDYVLNFE